MKKRNQRGDGDSASEIQVMLPSKKMCSPSLHMAEMPDLQRDRKQLEIASLRSVATEFHSVLNSSCSALTRKCVEIRALLEEYSKGENKLVFQPISQNSFAESLTEQRVKLGTRAMKCQLYEQSKNGIISSCPENQHPLIFSAKKPNKPGNPKPQENLNLIVAPG